MRGRDYPYPDPDPLIDEKLKRIAKAFKESLASVADLAKSGEDPAKRFASEETSGMPKKHVVAAIFAICESTFGEIFGPVRWRCSMSEGTNKTTKQITRRVKTIAKETAPEVWKGIDKWVATQEFMHDFSVSNHSIPLVTGKKAGWENNTRPFQLHLAVESEMNASGPEKRQYAVARDMVKLCLTQCTVKAVVYRGYPDIAYYGNQEKRKAMLTALVRTIKRFPPEDAQNTRWLFIGLVGDWPNETIPYFHTFKAGDEQEQPLLMQADPNAN